LTHSVGWIISNPGAALFARPPPHFSIALSTAALVGITGGWAWSYAIKNRRLMLPEVTDSYARQLQDRILAEPITATLTLLLAFVGPIIWEVGWLSYPLFVILVRRRRERKQSVD